MYNRWRITIALKYFEKFNNIISIIFVMFINNDCVHNNILIKRLKEDFV